MSDVVDAPSPADALNDALAEFTSCICLALPDICSCSLTIGQSYVPFRPDEDDECEDEEEACSQAWVRLVSSQPAESSVSGWGGDCSLVMTLTLEVGVLRCFPVEEDGEAPTGTDVMAAAFQSNDDMQTILCAALGCEVWDSLSVGQWSPIGPLGGQYGGTWTFTVEV